MRLLAHLTYVLPLVSLCLVIVASQSLKGLSKGRMSRQASATHTAGAGGMPRACVQLQFPRVSDLIIQFVWQW